jgi:hypothetical protein
MRITRDGGHITIRDRAGPHWFLGLAGALWWLGKSPASRAEVDLTRSRVSVVRWGLSGREVRELAFKDLKRVEVEVGADSDGATVWRPALRLRSSERVLLSQLWTHDPREANEVSAAGHLALGSLAIEAIR